MKVFTLVRVDIRKPYENFLNLREATELSVIGTYPDRETAEDEMMWRIQNDFYHVWQDTLSRHETHITAEQEFSMWIKERFVSDDEWAVSCGSRMYMLRIQETEL